MQKMIAVDPETYEKIVALANTNGRTIGGQITWMLRDITLIPAPAIGGDPVIVLNIKHVKPAPEMELINWEESRMK